MIFTIGHSTHTADEFLALLEAHHVTGVGDVRAVPRSRRHPHFSGDALAAFLEPRRIAYTHFPGLGGHRRPRPDSVNGGWHHPAFRGYADYMETPAFRGALDLLVTSTRDRPTAIMCAEAKWWQCHRQLIADALVARGFQVRHIMSARNAPDHALTAFARVVGDEVRYPALL